MDSFLILYGKTLKEEADERDLREAFRMLDKNKRGEIDTEDLRFAHDSSAFELFILVIKMK